MHVETTNHTCQLWGDVVPAVEHVYNCLIWVGAVHVSRWVHDAHSKLLSDQLVVLAIDLIYCSVALEVSGVTTEYRNRVRRILI